MSRGVDEQLEDQRQPAPVPRPKPKSREPPSPIKVLRGDKLVWILWAELRVNGDVEGMRTPTGIIPKHKDLAKLFKEKLGAEFTQADYVRQFTFRIRENLAKLDRVEKIYKEKVADAPEILYRTFAEARKRLKAAAEEHGDNISPLDLPSE